jgi:formamidopyrimidine-DNA glycosylase
VPEWPDLNVLRGRLERALVGRRIVDCRVLEPTVIRATRDPREILVGRRFLSVGHRGKFLLFELDEDARVVVNPMLSGLFELGPADGRPPAATRFSLVLDDGVALSYRDDTRMGKVYLLEGSSPDTVPGYAEMGPEAGELGWSAADLRDSFRKRRGLLRHALMDQRLLAGIGNAYADEILWAARLHPKRPSGSLSEDEARALLDGIREVLRGAVAHVERSLPTKLGAKVRDHMKVRGRAGELCPRCGAAIVRRHLGVEDTYLCLRCQPPPKGAF